jgi:uncharacterized protein involved in exopolysaccharide biosynthesis
VSVGLLIGILFAFLLPQEFESETQLMPRDSQSSSGMLLSAGAITGDTLGSVAGDVLGIKNSGALFVGVLRSRTVLARLVQRLDLRNVLRPDGQSDFLGSVELRFYPHLRSQKN